MELRILLLRRPDQEDRILPALFRTKHQRLVGRVVERFGGLCVVGVVRQSAADAEDAAALGTEHLEVGIGNRMPEAGEDVDDRLGYARDWLRQSLGVARLARAF